MQTRVKAPTSTTTVVNDKKLPMSDDHQPTTCQTGPQLEESYTTFTNRQIWLIVSIVSTAATFSGFASNIYFPALPAIAADLDVSVTLVNLTVTSYMIFQGLAPSLWGAVADVKGRRLTYICTFLAFLGACLGLANTQNYATLITLRCLQSTGSASTIAIGSGVIGDITTREERGGYMGIFQAGLLVPVAAGPIVGGALAGSLGWRSVFWFLAIYAAIFLLVLILLLPETLRLLVGNGRRLPDTIVARYPLTVYQHHSKTVPTYDDSNVETGKPHIDFLAPLKVLSNTSTLLPITLVATYYAVWQMSITCMSTLFASDYHLGETAIGLTFIANGIGSMIGTLTTGKLLDIDYQRLKVKHDTEKHEVNIAFPLEKARLRLLPLWCLLQITSITIFGWTLRYRVHISIPIITTFFTGWGAVSIQSTIITYLVDLFPEKSASASAALNLASCLLGAAGTAVASPMIEGVGAGWCFTILSAIMAVTLMLIVGRMWFRMRIWNTRAGGGQVIRHREEHKGLHKKTLSIMARRCG